MKGLRLKAIVLLILFVLLCSTCFDTCNARRSTRHWRARRSSSSNSLAQKKGKAKGKGGSHHHGGGAPKQKPKPDIAYPPSSQVSSLFNVVDFGAKGDGVTDDTKAFQAAWAASCKVEASTMVVPSASVFLVGPISFSGPYCQPNIIFQLDGKIIAPTSPKAWGSGLLQWLEFTKLRGIAIRGNGTIEGQGSVWWTNTQFEDDPVTIELSKKMPSIKPTALRFYGSTNVTVTGITIQNSPQCHLKFDNCESVLVYNMTVSSPANSLNTDGIHLQNSRGVTIHHAELGCGNFSTFLQHITRTMRCNI